MLQFLLVVQIIVTLLLVGTILMQQSEGGGLGMGGSPTGLMSARGAADFLTRMTTILAALFVMLSIASAVVASRAGGPGPIDTSLKRLQPKPEAPASAPSVPLNGDPVGVAPTGAVDAPAAVPPASTTAGSIEKAPSTTGKLAPRPATVPSSVRQAARDPRPVAGPPTVVPTVAAPAPAAPAGNAN